MKSEVFVTKNLILTFSLRISRYAEGGVCPPLRIFALRLDALVNDAVDELSQGVLLTTAGVSTPIRRWPLGRRAYKAALARRHVGPVEPIVV